MRCLITGIGGFAGFHLASSLLTHGHEVGGVAWPPESWCAEELPRLWVRTVDINHSDDIRAVIAEFAPEVIYHLAGIANVKIAWESKRAALETNFIGAFNVLDAAASLSPHPPRVLLVGSSEEYGPVPPERQPITENCELDPRNPYGVSKVAMEYLGKQYHRSLGLAVFLVRSFNHIGPRQSPIFVASSFAKQIAEIECRKRDNTILVGNLDIRRDFTDVRDTVRAYSMVVERGVPGDAYNVCSGTPIRVASILDQLVASAACTVHVAVDPERCRAVDMPIFCGDSSKIRQQCGWQPEIPIKQTLMDLLNYWRDIVKR